MTTFFRDVIPFIDITYEDVPIIGMKGKIIKALIDANIPIPPGFIITGSAYKKFVKDNRLQQKIQVVLHTIKLNQVHQYSELFKAEIMKADMSQEIIDLIFSDYKKLGHVLHTAPVIVFLSPPDGNSIVPHYHQSTIIHGEANLLLRIKEIWTKCIVEEITHWNGNSLFELSHTIAIIVQKLLAVESSGVIYSDKQDIHMRALFGEWDTNAPTDHYLISQSPNHGIEKKIVKQMTALRYKKVTRIRQKIARAGEIRQKISTQNIQRLSDLYLQISQLFSVPQEAMWAIVKDKIYITGIKPLEEKKKEIPRFYSVIATKIYIRITANNSIKQISRQQCDGSIFDPVDILKQTNIHPQKLRDDKNQNLLLDRLTDVLQILCKSLSPRPVIYKPLDLLTYEYRNLMDGKMYEPQEKNPLLGYHGASRILVDPYLFTLELRMIKKLRNAGLKNLSLLLPGVRNVKELTAIKQLITAAEIYRSSSCKLWFSVETPENIISLDSYIKTGVDAICIHFNHVASLLLGVDRDNMEVQHLFNDDNSALILALQEVIQHAHSYSLPVILYTQAKTISSNFLEKLLSFGCNGIVVGANEIDTTRQLTSLLEKQLYG